MRKLFFLLTLLSISLGINAQTFKASAPSTVIVGQQFRVTYSCDQQGKDFRGPEFSDFDVLFGPVTGSSHSTQIVNGQVTSVSSYSYVFTLMASKEGTFTIQPASIKLGNSEYKSNALTIKVLPQDKAAAGGNEGGNNSGAGNSGAIAADDVFARVILSKNSVYENEPVTVSFKLYTTRDLQVENIKFPEFEGFMSQEVELKNPQWGLENYNGRNYRSVVVKQTVLYPQRSGKLPISAGRFDLIVTVRSQQRIRSIFDDFFDQSYQVKKTINTPATSIDVKPLPAGKPASFNGAVGDYKMTSAISATKLKANDAVTIKMTITGNGNLKLIKNPEVVFPNDFEVYDPKEDLKTNVSASGMSGSKTIEYYAIPRYAGDFTIPKAEFSYFDLSSKTYKTLSTEEYKLQVEPGEGGSGTQSIVSGITNKEDLKFVGKDIRYIRTKDFSFQKGDFFFGSISYWLFYLIPALLFIAFFIIYRKQAAENANIALVRTKKANKVAAKRLKTANKFLKENKKEAFYDEVMRALWGYLSDKLSIPVANLTKDNVEIELAKYGVSEELTKEFMDILATCEFARFAPAESIGTMDEMYNSTVSAIDKMENTIKK